MADNNEKMKKARISLLWTQPFFASLLLKMVIKEDPNFPTMATNGKELRYNPNYVDGLTPDEVKGVLAHEVMHTVLVHHTRRGNKDPERWNIACDYAVNILVTEAGFVLPEGGLLDKNYKGKSAEEIYSMLPQDKVDKLSQQKKDAQGQGGGGSGRFQKAPGADWDMGSVEDAPSPSDPSKTATPQEMEQVEAETKMNVAQSLHAAKMCGKAPAGLERLIEEMTEPKINWKEALARFMNEISKNDYSFSRPNRRFMPQGIYMPTLRSPELGEIAVLVDTSGSIGKKELTEIVAEVLGVAQEYNGSDTEITVVYVDSKVAGHQRLTFDDIPNGIDPKGGGGTDFKPGFEWLEENGEEPVCILYFTDGYCSSFPQDPGTPTMWVLTERNRSFKPPFGDVATMNWGE